MQDRAKANHDLGKDAKINHVLGKDAKINHVLGKRSMVANAFFFENSALNIQVFIQKMHSGLKFARAVFGYQGLVFENSALNL